MWSASGHGGVFIFYLFICRLCLRVRTRSKPDFVEAEFNSSAGSELLHIETAVNLTPGLEDN